MIKTLRAPTAIALPSAVHGKLEGKHLLNTEPREDFGFHENAEEDANGARKFLRFRDKDEGNKIQDVMRPPVKKPAPPQAVKVAQALMACPECTPRRVFETDQEPSADDKEQALPVVER